MRITGGMFAGRTVKVPPGVIRPAMDRMRESVFAVLGPLHDFSVLDLFAGSGVMGLEAVSRGARLATLVERDGGKRAVLRENVALCPDRIHIVIGPVERFVASCRNSYDLVCLDPPFDYRFKTDLLQRIERKRLVSESGTLIIHYPHPEDLPDTIGRLTCTDERVYGRSHVRFYTAG